MQRNVKIHRSRGKAPSQRQLRVGEELRHGLVRILGRDGFRDPALLGANLTVTEVRVSPDLKNATAFVMPLGGAEVEATVEALNRAAGFIRGQLAHEVELRHTPRLGFRADSSFDYAHRIGEILDRPKVQQDVHRTGAESREGGGDGG
ncbi:MAG: 30S ribosome-binding factor RbfA [Kiloniellaceae bacterium]